MSRIVLDFEGIRSLQELHEYFRRVFELPEYYGRNMDALWDCLSCCYDASTTIELRNLDAIPEEMAQSAEMVRALFEDLHQTDGVMIEMINT